MSARTRILVLFLTLCYTATTSLIGQHDSSESFYSYIKSAKEFDRVLLYEKEVESLQNAIQVAERNNLEKERIRATIDLAELKRKTKDFSRGINLLMSLSNTEKYPELHIRKMGRLAAIYNEYEIDPNDYGRFDSVTHYLNLAIPLAESGNYKDEEASLKNELACFLQWTKGDSTSLPLFKESAKIFQELNDTANYAVVLTHIMDCYFKLGKLQLAKEVERDLLELIESHNWPQITINYYNLLKGVAKENGDSLSYYRYAYLAEKNAINHVESSYSNKMATFQVLYDVESYRAETQKKEQELAEEARLNKLLAGFISALLILIVGIIFLLARERKLKRILDSTNVDLQSANDKYQMLLVESNHRIKNNLQMVISMLDYAEEDMGSNSLSAFQRMSGKVQTVSALHKHLYLETHNENVNLKFYFTEILDLYEKLSSEKFKVKSSLHPELQLPSERLVYFGLVFNEMIANTIEHHTSENIYINISVEKVADHYKYIYTDASKFESGSTKGTGSVLIEELINRVEGFNFNHDSNWGTYEFEFYV